jgi:hypothetical protein
VAGYRLDPLKEETFCAETSVNNCQPIPPRNTAEERRPELPRSTAPYAAATRSISKICNQQQGHVSVLQAAELAPVLQQNNYRKPTAISPNIRGLIGRDSV